MKTTSLKINTEDIQEAIKTLQKFKKQKTEEEIFYHLCFVILISQAKWTSVRDIVEDLKRRDYYNNPIDFHDLVEIVKKSRFKNRKAKFLNNMRFYWINYLAIIESNCSVLEKRNSLADSVKGLGMKTASHFLRNMGVEGLAIIDTHIIKFLGKESGPKSKQEYLNMEKEFLDLAKSLDISASVLDAIVWKEFAGITWEEFNY